MRRGTDLTLTLDISLQVIVDIDTRALALSFKYRYCHAFVRHAHMIFRLRQISQQYTLVDIYNFIEKV